ncbi:MAG: ThuA domain-containing protein [Balneolales bacterium]
MKYFIRTSALLILFAFAACDRGGREDALSDGDADRSLLVFSKTDGFRHGSIEAGQDALQKLGIENNVTVYVTEDASEFTEEFLSGMDAVVFLNTTQTLFNDEQRTAFKGYIQNGGGFAGVHSAADTEYDWPWYNGLVGAWFNNHPPGTPKALLNVVDPNHPSTEGLPQIWEKVDEWYNFRDISENINVLITLDTDSYEGSDHPGNHPVAWFHEYDGGRAFYTALGHTSESYTEDLFLDHLWNGIGYAMGIHGGRHE